MPPRRLFEVDDVVAPLVHNQPSARPTMARWHKSAAPRTLCLLCEQSPLVVVVAGRSIIVKSSRTWEGRAGGGDSSASTRSGNATAVTVRPASLYGGKRTKSDTDVVSRTSCHGEPSIRGRGGNTRRRCETNGSYTGNNPPDATPICNGIGPKGRPRLTTSSASRSRCAVMTASLRHGSADQKMIPAPDGFNWRPPTGTQR